MKNEFELIAEPRNDVGRSANRRLRRSGRVPGIVYGADLETTSISLDHNHITSKLENEAFYSHVLTLNLAKEKLKVVLKDLQRHPYKLTIMHIDLQRIQEKEKLTMRVPIHIINEESCPGVKLENGIATSLMSDLEIVCYPKDLPEYIEIDIGELHVGDSVHLSDIKLPADVELDVLISGGDPRQGVISILPPQIEEEVEVPVEGVEEGLAAEAAAPGEEADEGEQSSEED
jgi:large subunit ribosomal protein L25